MDKEPSSPLTWDILIKCNMGDAAQQKSWNEYLETKKLVKLNADTFGVWNMNVKKILSLFKASVYLTAESLIAVEEDEEINKRSRVIAFWLFWSTEPHVRMSIVENKLITAFEVYTHICRRYERPFNLEMKRKGGELLGWPRPTENQLIDALEKLEKSQNEICFLPAKFKQALAIKAQQWIVELDPRLADDTKEYEKLHEIVQTSRHYGSNIRESYDHKRKRKGGGLLDWPRPTQNQLMDALEKLETKSRPLPAKFQQALITKAQQWIVELDPHLARDTDELETLSGIVETSRKYGRYRHSKEKYNRDSRNCFNCGKQGHVKINCREWCRFCKEAHDFRRCLPSLLAKVKALEVSSIPSI